MATSYPPDDLCIVGLGPNRVGNIEASAERTVDLSNRCYVYAVIPHNDRAPARLPVEGLDGAPVEELACGDVAALVSSYEADRVRSSRANLSAHEAVVEAARRSGRTTVLPLRFGVVVPSRAAVVDSYLAPNQARLSELLGQLAYQVEFRLTAGYLPDVALREVVSSNRQIQRLQAQIRARSQTSTYHARIQLGEMVAAALEEVKGRDARRILGFLQHRCVRYETLATNAENLAVRAALLLHEDQVPRFHQDVDELADEVHGRLELTLVGPLAPWDFVDLGPTAH
jgi:Gas vesicle synthesis protein GvpL/GvpF